MYSSFLMNKVPPNWEKVAYLSLKPLASWVNDLVERVEFMREWLTGGHPPCFWLSGFFFPHGFMTGALQTYARKKNKAIDLIRFSFKVLKDKERKDITVGPEDGIYINGLFLEGAKWNDEHDMIEDQDYGQMHCQMPIIHFLPKDDHVINQEDYICPVYKTSVRAGVLTTTGQSSNFILPVELPTVNKPQYWTLRSVAMLTMLDD